jgi:2-polyprenyl-3-methyl-5-hydroxy-6-metoxy-1,4-benzoquinol methylase
MSNELCNKEMSMDHRRENTTLDWIGESAEIHYGHLHQYRFAKEFAKGKKVLDLACGEGYGSFMLSEEADSVIGIDIDEETVRHASSEYVKENLRFIKGSIMDIPIHGEKIFDVIVCFKVPDHLEERHELLKEVKRLLKTDGIFIASTHNKYISMDELNDQTPFHLKELYFDEFKDLLSKNFKSVLLYGQKVYHCSNIFPLHEESGSTKDFAIEKSDKEFHFVPSEKKLVRYLIAVASDSSLGKNLVLGNCYVLDLPEALFQQKDAQISRLKRVVREKQVALYQRDAEISSLERVVRSKEAALGQIYASYGWKALLTFYRLIDKIFPINTKRRFTAKVIFKILTELRTVFKNISIRNLKNFFTYRQASIIQKCSVCGAQINFSPNYFIDNLRETIICYSCNSWKRNIDLAESILKTYNIPSSSSLADSLDRFANLSIYEVGHTGSIHDLFSCLPYFTYSGFSADVKPGSLLPSGARCEDVQSLTFEDNSFDLVISQEVFEHVAQPELGFKEIYRILKPGGYHIFTVPYHKGTHKSLTRAVLEDYEIKHLLSPVYHGSPSEPMETLVFTDFGEDLIDLLQSTGFDVDLYEKNNVDYKNGRTIVFITKKNGCGTERLVPAKEQITEMSGERPYHGNVRLIAFYLPQFHPIPENDEWWGKGFTDWTNVAKARPNFIGHYQPHLPADLGFYDLRVAEVREQQAELAREHGIYGFCYHHYWFNGHRLLERPFNEVLKTGRPDFPFCLCWANENWSRRWDGQEHEILIAQVHSKEDDIAFIRDIIPAFRDDRYIRVNGRPLLIVYRVNLLPDPKATAEIWRAECRALGIGEIYLCAAQSFGITDPRPYGFDAAVEFPPHGLALSLSEITEQVQITNPDFTGRIFGYKEVVQFEKKKKRPHYILFKTVMPSWDSTPRLQNTSNIFAHTTPDLYEEWLAYVIEYSNKNLFGDERLVFINAWNEWGEGCHLEPDRKYGSKFLKATERVLEKFRSNSSITDSICGSRRL